MTNATTYAGTTWTPSPSLDAYAWPGGYPIHYVVQDGGTLCADCANENRELSGDSVAMPDWNVIGGEINYEDDDLTCDNCYKPIESAYGDNGHTFVDGECHTCDVHL